MIKLISKPIYLKKLQTGGLIPKAQKGLPIGTKAQYDLVTQIYQGLVDRGVSPQSALELVNQKIAERGWTDYSTGDLKVFPNVSSFVKHLVDWHGRMYPNSLKARNFNEFYEGINGTKEQHERNRRSKGKDNSGRYYYNTEKGWEGYKKDLLTTRPGVLKRINYYRAQKGLSPLAYTDQPIDDNNTNLMA